MAAKSNVPYLSIRKEDEKEVFDAEEMIQVKVLMALVDDELAIGKNHARNGEWINITMRKLTEALSKTDVKENAFIHAFMDCDHEMIAKSKDYVKRHNPNSNLPNFNVGRILVPRSQAVNKSLGLTQGASPSSEVMSLTYQEHSPRERPSLGTMKHTKPDIQKSSSKSVSGHVTVCNTEPVISSVPTKVKQNEQESKINELTKLVQMLMDEKILKAKAKLFPPCTYYGFNDHHHDDYHMYPEFEIYGSYDHGTSGHNHVILVGERRIREPICHVFIHNHKDHLGKFDAKVDDGYFLGYSFVSKAFKVFNTRRQQVEETYHITFDESMKAIMFTNTLVDDIGIDDSSRYPPDEYLHEDDTSRQYQKYFDTSYYITPHNRSLTELTKTTHVLKVITLNEQNTPLTKDIKGPPDLINTEGTQEQKV
ncbi:retrovirus-related pol polyprotein from transposon TNT 1-94 [Tanacetum coccineum]